MHGSELKMKAGRRVISLLICFSILAGFLASTVANVSAASTSTEFYSDYNTVVNIYNYGGCTGMQGMAVDDTYIYSVKINSSTETSAFIARTHKDTGSTVYLTDSSSGSEFFTYLSHANDLGVAEIAGLTTLFVTPSLSGSESLIRYVVEGTTITKVGNYTAVYNGTEIPLSSAQVISSNDTEIKLICKRGKYLYTGTIGTHDTSGTLTLTHLCTLDVANVMINGVNYDLSDYLHQGFGYIDNQIFVPLTDSVDMSISVIAVYDIEGVSGTIRNDPTLSFRIDSATYANKFEIESCGICPSDGKLYFNTNRATTSSDANYDALHYIAGYVYDPTHGDSAEPGNYRWELSNDILTSVTTDGAVYNGAVTHGGSITDGVFTDSRHYLKQSINLMHDSPWIVEWKSEGAWTTGSLLFSSSDISKYEGNQYFFRRKNSTLLAFGEYTDGTFHNYGLNLSTYGIDGTAEHTYRLVNRIADDGSNMVYLFVDGVELGPMNNYHIGGTSQGTTSDWISGKDFSFSYMGTDQHPVSECSIDYIQVWGNGVADQRDGANIFRWETQNDQMTSIAQPGFTDNAANVLWGSCTDGVYSGSQMNLDQKVVLLHDRPWSVQWQSEGAWTGGALLLASAKHSKTYHAPFLFRNSNSLIAIGYHDGSQFNNYGLKLTDHSIDASASHVYRLTNRIADDGSNMVYLYVDGIEVGAMNQYFVGGTAQNTTSDWICGKDFTFTYFGTYQHDITDASIGHIQIWEDCEPSVDSPDNFRWETNNDTLTSITTDGYTENIAHIRSGSITDGVYSGTYAVLGQTVILRHDRQWYISWQSEGDWKDAQNGTLLLSSAPNANTANTVYLYRRGGSDIIALGHRYNSKHHNYGLKLSDYGIDGTVSHTYSLMNRIADDGSNMVYLYVDGEEVGPMNRYYISGTDQGTTDNWISGKDLVFSYLGTENFTIGGCSLDYIQISEGELPTGTVEFRDWDGTVISSAVYSYGDEVTVPADPSRAADNTYRYTFAGWDQEIVTCSGDAVYTATYTGTYIDYTVTFQDWDGTVLSSGTYHYGDTVTAPEDPVRTEDDANTYTFAGWDKTVIACDGDAVYTATYTTTAKLNPTIKPLYPTLLLKDEVHLLIYFSAVDLDGVALSDMGLITWSSPQTDGTVETAETIIPQASYDSTTGYYSVRSGGITAKKLGDTLYFKIYAKLADGSYLYTGLLSYSPKTYAYNSLKSATSTTEEKALVVAMLNYGAAAQTYFNYKPYSLMNSDLTEEQMALVEDYRSDMVTTVEKADSAKQGQFIANGGFSSRVPSVSVTSAFSINYRFAPANAVAGEMTFYYWDQAAYDSNSVLTPENATGVSVMELDSGYYCAAVTGIAAKGIDQAIYVAGVYTAEDGTVYSTGVLEYSLGSYCARMASGTDESLQPVAKAIAVYGYYAKAFFSN